MCIFCKIITKEIPSNMILEDDNFCAFDDVAPKASVHILIVPKLHIDSFQNINSALMSKMTTFIQGLAKKIGVDENGYRLITNIGEDGKQEVKHLHFHLLAGKDVSTF